MFKDKSTSFIAAMALSAIAIVLAAISMNLTVAAVTSHGSSEQEEFEAKILQQHKSVEADAVDADQLSSSGLTKEELATIGRKPCLSLTTDEFVSAGITKVGLTEYTYVDDSILSLNALTATVDGWHADDEGVFKDGDGLVVCYSYTRKMGELVETPLGVGRVYDITSQEAERTVGVFLHKES